MIGNQSYLPEVGPLQNPQNDVRHVAAALTKLGFQVGIVTDAGYGQLLKAIKKYVRRLRRAGSNAIGFFYYSGHGAADEHTRYNYLIPIDVTKASGSDLWDNSIRLKTVIDQLREEAQNATHFVVFDACRNQLQFRKEGARSLSQAKGFEPVRKVNGMLIAYSTAEGQIALDIGAKLGPYAQELSREIVQPGVEAVTMFRRVQLKVARTIAQEPWLTYGTLPEVYFAGRHRPDVLKWTEIKDSDRIDEFVAYLKQYPDSQFGESARLHIKILKERELNQAAASDWEALEASKSIQALEQYATTYPNHAYSNFARFRIKELRGQAARNEHLVAWNAIKDTNKTDLLERFIKRYPDSFFATVAADKIAVLKRKTASPILSKDALAAKIWEEIRKSTDPATFLKFIEQYSDRALSGLAESRLKELRQQKVATLPKLPEALAKAGDQTNAGSETRIAPGHKPIERTDDAQISVTDLTKSLQRELDRVGCDPGPIDGMWGARGRQAIERFNAHAKLTLDKIAPTLAAVEAIRRNKERVCPKVIVKKDASVENELSSRNAASIERPNALRYSRKIWAYGSLPFGNAESRNTKYGHLTCVGGSNRNNIPRRCRWH